MSDQKNTHAPSHAKAKRASSLVKWGGGAIAALLVLLGGYYLIAFVAAYVGGPALGNISGKVYLDDALLKTGDVQFVDEKGQSVKCFIQPDGTYEAKGIEHGKLIITVTQLNPKFKDGATRKKESKGNKSADDGEKQHLLPEIYADTMTSPLRFTLEKSSDVYNIRLKIEERIQPVR